MNGDQQAFSSVIVRGLRYCVRAVAVICGMLLVLFGGAALVITLGPSAPAVNGQPAPLAVKVIAGVIFAGVVLVGIVLVWFGFRRRKRHIVHRHDASVESGAVDAIRVQAACEPPAARPDAPAPSAQVPGPTCVPAELPERPNWKSAPYEAVALPSDGEHLGVAGPRQPGELIARCGPGELGKTHYVYLGIGMLMFAVLCFIAPDTFLTPKPGDEKMIRGISAAAGCVSALMGLAMLLGPFLKSAQIIELYATEIVEHRGDRSRRIPLSEIVRLELREFYEHRFAERTFLVTATIRSDRPLRFNSALKGDGEGIVAYLAEHVPNTEVIPFIG